MFSDISIIIYLLLQMLIVRLTNVTLQNYNNYMIYARNICIVRRNKNFNFIVTFLQLNCYYNVIVLTHTEKVFMTFENIQKEVERIQELAKGTILSKTELLIELQKLILEHDRMGRFFQQQIQVLQAELNKFNPVGVALIETLELIRGVKTDESYYTIAEAATVLGVQEQTVRQKIRGDKLQSFKIGKHQYINKSDVLNYTKIK